MKTLILLLMMLGVAYPVIDTTGAKKYVDGAKLSTNSENHYTVRTESVGNGFWFYDSLWTGNYKIPKDTAFAGADTIIVLDTVYARKWVIIPLDFNYDWLQVAYYDTGTTFDDSLKIERGIILHNNQGIPIDTIWHGVNFRDSTDANITTNFPVDDNSYHLYTVWDAIMGIYKITIKNVQAVTNRVTKIWGCAKKRSK